MSVRFEERSATLCDGTIVLVTNEHVRYGEKSDLREYLSERLGGHRVLVVERARLACVPAELAAALEAALQS